MTKRILVVGDVMVDKHRFGKVERISPEAPVPVVNEIECVSKLGAAANVAANIVSANIECVLAYKSCFDTSNNNSHDSFQAMCLKQKIMCSPLQTNEFGTITTKERIWAGDQQICRIDNETTEAPSEELENKWIKQLKNTIDKFNISVVIFSDYNKGTLTDKIIQEVVNYCTDKHIATILDPKRHTFHNLKNLTIIKPNELEAKSTHFNINELSSKLGTTSLINTLGAKGMDLYRSGEFLEHSPAYASPEDVVDVCGCGDTVSALLAIGLYLNDDIETCMDNASSAAADSVTYKGCHVFTQETMSRILGKNNGT